MGQKPVIHGPDHRPVGWNSPTDPGGADPLSWLDQSTDANHIVYFNRDLQEDTFLYANADGRVSVGDDSGIHLVADPYFLLLEHGTGLKAASLQLYDNGTDGVIGGHAQEIIFEAETLGFHIINNGGTHDIVRVDSDGTLHVFDATTPFGENLRVDPNGTIHGRTAVGAITWDL